ncbi:MAG: glycosyltransferase family 4 protein [Phycisphaerae bacterium]|nr:glycosyltransferase family 4 protein [Phycisphaerae bacterium]
MARPLTILMQNRPDSLTHPGGDTVQMERTAAFLRDQGHRIDISLESAPDLRAYDLVHMFNLTRPLETHAQAVNAVRQRKPYLLSSVYWNLESAVPWSAYEFPRNYWRRFVPVSVRNAIHSARGRIRGVAATSGDAATLQAQIVRDAAFILPNSQAEKRHLLEQFPFLPHDRLVVVLNGIDPPESESSSQSESADDGASTGDARGAFVCAGAIGPRKNQLNLVRAFRELGDERLVIIGNPSPGSDRYLRAVQVASGAHVTMHNAVDHARMHAILRGAKALVQPSYIETPGLAAMEAAAMGVPIVVGDLPPVREYFGELGFYCNPNSTRSIAEACRAVLAAPRRGGQEFAARFEWRTVLRPLISVCAELADAV